MWHKLLEDGSWSDWTGSMPSIDLIIVVRDDSGDSTNYYTTSGWCLDDKFWISNNELVFGDVLAWRLFPDPREVDERWR